MKKILVIDDEPSVTKLFRSFLEGQGFSVKTALDGKEGLRSLEEECPDLVITDIMMPGMNGIELICAARKLHPDLPVVAISGGMKAASMDGLPQAAILDSCRILEKPVMLSDLLEVVNELIDEA